MNTFYINTYRREDTKGAYEGTHSGSSSIAFTEDIVVLYEGYAYSDTDGDTRFEGSDYDIIPRTYIERIVSCIPEADKNESILDEYENAYDYYHSLTSDSEKTFFISTLHCYKTDHNFAKLVKIALDNDMPCQHHQTRWN